ncbi:hypothetical protein AALP_AA7G146600 [Arabis alpina]|uniref:Uncharacterized protein n=1 Tax=Arabis alpina TaxID=50452 RepID=A0A087GI30_ARAAL|nr:hypothetical protein AALP_AA7G146600 [Arabis alpina]
MVETAIALDVSNQVMRMKKDVIDGIISFLDKSNNVSAAANHPANVERSNANNGRNTENKKQVHYDGCAVEVQKNQRNPCQHQAIDNIIGGVLGDLAHITHRIGHQTGKLITGNGGNCSEVGDHTPTDNLTAIDPSDIVIGDVNDTVNHETHCEC